MIDFFTVDSEHGIQLQPPDAKYNKKLLLHPNLLPRALSFYIITNPPHPLPPSPKTSLHHSALTDPRYNSRTKLTNRSLWAPLNRADRTSMHRHCGAHSCRSMSE